MEPPYRTTLADGRRRHFQHGPIDLVIEAFGPPDEVARAYEQAWHRFETILVELVDELPLLKRRVTGRRRPRARGSTAQRMIAAAWPHRRVFVTPMAAVAGAVADEVLGALVAGRTLTRAYVNDGGDIAIHLAPHERFTTGLVTTPTRPAIDGDVVLRADMPVRGIATSGRDGRSFSFGIADAVTVLARDAAQADAAATLIADAVDVAHPAIERRAAVELDPQSDLGERLITVAVGALDEASVATALDRGVNRAEEMRRAGLIESALLCLAGQSRSVSDAARMISERDLHAAW